MTIKQPCYGKKVIYGFDLLKFIMALLIVSIHARAFNDTSYSEYFRIVQTWCVPTFFFLSSYFLMRKFVNTENNRIVVWSRFIKRLGCLYVLWFAINIPIYISQHHFSGIPVHDIAIDFIKNILFASTFEGSWFLSALGVSVSLLFILACFGINRWIILGVFTGLYVCMYVCMYAVEYDVLHTHHFYNWYMTNIYDTPTLSFPRALPFIALGYVMATPDVSQVIDRVSGHRSRHLIPIILILLLLIGVWVNNIIIEQFVTLLAVPFIVIYFYGMELHESKVWKIMRDCSILFYLLHFMVIVYFRHIPILCQLNGIIKYLGVLSIISLVSLSIIRLSNNPKTKILKYLY